MSDVPNLQYEKMKLSKENVIKALSNVSEPALYKVSSIFFSCYIVSI